MTTITTILALIPFLFGTGMGVALQRPLALTVIGGLALGTLVSLYLQIAHANPQTKFCEKVQAALR